MQKIEVARWKVEGFFFFQIFSLRIHEEESLAKQKRKLEDSTKGIYLFKGGCDDNSNGQGKN